MIPSIGGKNTASGSILLALFCLGVLSPQAKEPCPTGSQTMYFSFNQKLLARTSQNLDSTLFQFLSQELTPLSYCLERAMAQSIFMQNALMLYVTGDESKPILTALLAPALNPFPQDSIQHARPLAELTFSTADSASLAEIMGRKIAENLRTFDHLPRYTPIHHEVALKPHRFYHSHWVYPTLASFGASALLFALSWHEVQLYRDLNQDDAIQNPNAFGERFHRAQNLEYASFGFLGVAGICLGISFKF